MKLDILAIAAHPDDVELTCGGTLLESRRSGLQDGHPGPDRGRDGNAGNAGDTLKGSREGGADVARGASRKFAAAGRASRSYDANKARRRGENSRAPAAHGDSSLLGWAAPDHYTAARLGYEGCFLAGLKQLPIEGEAFRPFKILYSTVYYREVRPTFVVDISRYFDRRYQAILAYHSQFGPKAKDKKSKVDIPLDRLHHEVNLIARYYGHMAGVEYAEPFLVKEVMQVEDVDQTAGALDLGRDRNASSLRFPGPWSSLATSGRRRCLSTRTRTIDSVAAPGGPQDSNRGQSLVVELGHKETSPRSRLSSRPAQSVCAGPQSA